ncbi:putative 2,3-bisphosphoglycerate-dependent phosphoglycerate mutase [Gordonia hirsuta DSM 44140 = NBRC 16056]|uniref:Putative 2,3-bisphosphoglycerate-dependent phosphoglycerate mutase n=1 Tax=Gordonia hirsuta DSM 44140 = NBRC 16056 TaxID=1121927 RepID=L7LAY2_9ACTN|nr:histidine phosphatase family protein [Gordonia hirsuta]GAC58059.1 putative 2,3-bisphosphoglycerate-dependent phosphoglycerate mutase [Gordonia hirsuta DSM 44140 = NBRC 16056]
MARLVLVRHGETTANIRQQLDTALPGAHLTDFGASQGIRFGLNNPLSAPAVLLSSHAHRARQTAELIASAWDVDTAAIDDVHEVQAGDLEGRSDREAHELFRNVVEAWYRGDQDTRLPGGESLEMLRDRYLPVINDLADRHLLSADPRDVYVVSHGAAIRLVAAHLAGVESDFAFKNHLRNTDSVELELTPQGWELRRWGSVTEFVTDDDEPLG